MDSCLTKTFLEELTMFLLNFLFPRKRLVSKEIVSIPRILKGVSFYDLGQMVLHWTCPFCKKGMVFFKGTCNCHCVGGLWVGGKNNEAKGFIRNLQSEERGSITGSTIGMGLGIRVYEKEYTIKYPDKEMLREGENVYLDVKERKLEITEEMKKILKENDPNILKGRYVFLEIDSEILKTSDLKRISGGRPATIFETIAFLIDRKGEFVSTGNYWPDLTGSMIIDFDFAVIMPNSSPLSPSNIVFVSLKKGNGIRLGDARRNKYLCLFKKQD